MTLFVSMLLQFLLCWALLIIPSSSFPPSNRFAVVSGTLLRRHNLSPEKVAAAREELVDAETVDLCIVGGGISGLASAITAAEKNRDASILLLESESTIGGRVRSDYTSDGYTLDRGFAVFIEEYPTSKKLLDYDSLGLAQFLPGARVKLADRDDLAPVSDPLRRRRDILKAITSPVGSLVDKARLVPLFYNVVTKNVEDLFSMEETNTLTCLKDKYKFSDEFISSFFAPFLEGIYLTPLEKQSSRMFHFVFRMFTLGSASLPAGGMQSVTNQLGNKAQNLGVKIECDSLVLSLEKDDLNKRFRLRVKSHSNPKSERVVKASSVVIATDEMVSRRLLGNVDGLNKINDLPVLSQRSVGCIYYAFPSPAPLQEPILILNGEGNESRNSKDFPINNVCFPSVVQQNGYAPDGYELCSVSMLENAINEHSRDIESLDSSVRNQLAKWFPSHASQIMDESTWELKGIYFINNAQPCHFEEDGSANIHGGRDCTKYRGIPLTPGIFVAGDHVATSTFNGALESGVNAGEAASSFLQVIRF
mmetsp:Transcript_755/g.1447  ORF Transcript_755/g.1447 Transcript_755/m.1447 type:complete len:535 (-) Transcript_755:9-1613(-)